MFKWIPEFDVNIKKGHIILYIVVTAGILWIAQHVYNLGYDTGWYDCADWYESRIVQPLDENFDPFTPAPYPAPKPLP